MPQCVVLLFSVIVVNLQCKLTAEIIIGQSVKYPSSHASYMIFKPLLSTLTGVVALKELIVKLFLCAFIVESHPPIVCATSSVATGLQWC